MITEVLGIVQVLDGTYPALGGGGAEAQVTTVSQWLDERGLQTTVVAPMVLDGAQRTRDRVGRVPVVRIAYPHWPWIGSLIMLCKLALLLFLNRRRIQAIHAHIGNNMAAVATVVGRLTGKPVIVKMTGMTEMIGGVLDPAAGIGTRIKRRMIGQATAIQATSSAIVERATRCGFDPARIHRLPNAVDVERFNPSRRSARPDATPLTAIYVGRLEAEKGVELLIRAWAQAFRNDPAMRLVMVGAGTLDADLKALATRSGCAPTVEFVGQTEAVADYLGRADFGVLASFAEGLSNTMLESLASGLPMIVSRVSGAEDFIEHGVTGWIFEPGDCDGLVQRLHEARATGRAGLRTMGVAARQQIVDRASITSIGSSLLTLYGVNTAACAV